jgi:hypothetical protein
MCRDANWRSLCSLVLSIAIVFAAPATVGAHGVVGKRWFPSTVVVEDPFVSDEASLVVSHIRGSDAKETELDAEITKRLSPNFAIGFGGSYRILNSLDPEEPNAYGFSNPEISLRYQFIRDPVHELASTVALGITPGGVGAKRVEALSETTLTPALQIGKGFGDLPDWADWLKPLAVTSSVGFNLFTGHSHTEELENSLEWGVTVMYSIPYLQSFVKDVGLPWPFNRLFPIVEFSGETLLTGHESGQTTAFANPGLIWAGKYFQLAVEAQIPLNEVSGHHVGVLGMIHFFLDDIAPNIFTWTPFHGVLGPQSMPK